MDTKIMKETKKPIKPVIDETWQGDIVSFSRTENDWGLFLCWPENWIIKAANKVTRDRDSINFACPVGVYKY